MAKTKVLSVTERGMFAESEAQRELEERIQKYEDMGYEPMGGIDVSTTEVGGGFMSMAETKCTMAQTMKKK